jgi:thiamine biosynthesis lipoprotein
VQRAPEQSLRRVERVMGIPVGIEVAGVDARALDDAFAHLRWVDAVFSPFLADSEISRLDAGTLARCDASPDVRVVLDRCAALRARTGGWFDVRATGRLDPSGFVKGWALDGAAAILARAGARSFCLHAGGDVRVGGDRLWRVGIQHPLRRDRVAAVVGARDLGVATSGAYERGPHIVDPHCGRPPEGVLSVTVVAPDLGTADAYATAAFAMGLDGPAWTATLRDCEALTILADGRVLSTPGMDSLRLL